MSDKKTPKGRTTSTKQGTMAPSKAKDIRDNVANIGTALAPRPVEALTVVFNDAMVQAKSHIAEGLQGLTMAVAMKGLTTPQLASVFDYAASTLDAVDEAKKLARGRVLEVGMREGTPTGDKGSRRLDIGGGQYIPLTIQKSGLNGSKVEAALRAKGKDVPKYMDTVLSYKLKDGNTTRDMLLADGVFTLDELKTMEHEQSFRVDRPKTAKEE